MIDEVPCIESEEPRWEGMELLGLWLEDGEGEFFGEMHECEAFREEVAEGSGRLHVRGMEGDDVGSPRPASPLDREDALHRFAFRVDLVVVLLEGPVPRDRVPDRVRREEGPNRLAVFDAVGRRARTMLASQKRITAAPWNGFRLRFRGRPSRDPSPRRSRDRR